MKRLIFAFFLGIGIATLLLRLFDPSRFSSAEFSQERISDMPTQVSPRDETLQVMESSPELNEISSARATGGDTETGSSVAPVNDVVSSDEQRQPTRAPLAAEIQREDIDPIWAPETEDQLRSFLDDFIVDYRPENQQTLIANVQCRMTICEILILDDSFDTGANGLDGRWFFRDLDVFDQPWAAQFDPQRTQLSGSVENGVLEQRLYLKRKETDDPQ